MKLNKNFWNERRTFGGEVPILEGPHCTISFNNDFFEIGISLSWKFRLITIDLGLISIQFY